VTKTCLQCGAVLPSSARSCNFCEISMVVQSAHAVAIPPGRAEIPPSRNAQDDGAWRDELAHRLENYRGRKRKHMPNGAQSRFSFEEAAGAACAAPKRKSFAPQHNSQAFAPATV
jgi:hypothetical protein